ncbi:MAG: hydrolase 2, exosortase A system-associated [Gammaproteobacteria bacterium]|nr:hydrolase 2, exosortase A system-associated [Rhodocyclaceae bacterium]MBU3910164.1 hydrolase 2, exosortase A system-associated [Gammaproteobacteria bacterium]MBU3989173.1 hydrolase 2, exosortase A system-associated [Gammaproteobacteria bacterium]MBU4006171.1 hydrolase 2, exosortase A system-associated [Gammaproteobacteria bacterium]MBU4022626.1 hydrolase 2, exosortase A system-associated [Gammaproteobacteria bacterium]
MVPEVFFLPVANGQRLCLYYAPSGGQPKAALLYLHPFAEEMNKSRRMAALQAQMLAAHGYAVLQIDLHGCGDSSGDFGDATWQGWIQDVLDAHAWLRKRCQAPLWLWGLRTGCLLATQAAEQINEPANFLFWQPIASGKQFLQQFLRLKVAGELMTGESKGVMAALKQQLASGQTVEVSGYTLSAALAQGLEEAELLPPPQSGQLIWLELSTRADATLAPASLKRLEQWQGAGYRASSAVLPAPTFWQTTEIEEAPALLEATLAALETQAP